LKLAPPVILYYAQGINTTPIPSNTALFGVYDMLAISLLLCSVRNIVARSSWSDRMLKWSFWGLRARAKTTSHFVISDSGHLWLIFILEILEIARYSSGFAQSDQPNLTQIRAPILLSYFCANP
jgi:nitric oxide reductase large subunit